MIFALYFVSYWWRLLTGTGCNRSEPTITVVRFTVLQVVELGIQLSNVSFGVSSSEHLYYEWTIPCSFNYLLQTVLHYKDCTSRNAIFLKSVYVRRLFGYLASFFCVLCQPYRRIILWSFLVVFPLNINSKLMWILTNAKCVRNKQGFCIISHDNPFFRWQLWCLYFPA